MRTISKNCVRVTHFPSGLDTPQDRPWLKDVLLPMEENEKHGSEINASLQNGLVCVKNDQGECFFEEIAAPELAIKKQRSYRYFDIPQTAYYAGQHKVDGGIRLNLKIHHGESFYGWGEWFNAFERKSGQVNLDNRNALFGEQDRLTYSGMPFFLSSQGYGFLLLNSFRSQWTITNHELIIEADGPNADYILIYGPAYKEILRSYTALTGRPPLLPRWGFGLWVTGYPQEHQDNVLAYVRQHRKNRIPLDAVILDYHWEERFHNFKWRQKLMPNPHALAANLKNQGVHLGLILTSYLNTKNRPFQKWVLNTFGQNITPGLEGDDERALDEFAEAKEKGFLAHEKVRWWFGTGGMIDFTNPQAVTWWQNKLRPLFEVGADFIKNDDGEDLPDNAQAFIGMNGCEYHNIYGFYYGRATYDCPKNMLENSDAQPHPRKLIYARSTWVGSQRYPALFLGDQEANFEGIKRGIRAGLNLSLAGFSYWTADVFGLSGKTTPEIHMRYAQWSLLNPVARYFIRPAVIDDTRYPWSHNTQVENNFRKYAQLRMRLLPYYNNLAHQSYQTGLPIMRPLLMEYQDDTRMRSVDDQILLGSDLMICPITTPGALGRKIILPEGLWHDFWSEKTWQGPAEINYPAPLDCLPLLVRGGTILPLGLAAANIPNGQTFNSLELHIWPPFNSEGIFFDDDGCSNAYQQGAFSRTEIKVLENLDCLDIHIMAAQGQFEDQVTSRRINLLVHQTRIIEAVFANSEEIPFELSANDFVVIFDHIVDQDTIVKIRFRS